MHVRCSECGYRIDVGDEDALLEVHCPQCQSDIGLASEIADTQPLPPTETLGHFALIQQVGRGAFGSVWKARDTELDRFVAVKLPRQGQLSSADAGLFLREARAAAQLRHPNLVSIHEVGKSRSGQLYIVSDFIEGANLADWLQVKSLSIREAVNLVIVLAEAVQHAHDHGVIHRDLKPQNILMDADGVPHIADFGLAKRDAGDATMTAEGKIVGTPSYMSPEQAAGKAHSVDARSDIYSLGVVLFELLTRELPFRGSPQMLLLQILRDEPPSPRKFNAAINRDLETICLKCMEKDRDRRYQRASDLAADLNRFQHGSPIAARPVGPLDRGLRWCRRNPTVASLTAGVATLLLIMAVGSLVYSLRLRQHANEAEAYFRMSLDAVDSMLREVGEESLANIPNAEPVRLTLLERALEFQRELAAMKPLNDSLSLEIARAQHRTGDIYELLGEYDASRLAYEDAIKRFEELLTVLPDGSRAQSYLAVSHNELGELFRMSNPAEAESHYRKAKELQEQLNRRTPENAEYLRELNRTRNNLGLLLTEITRWDEAENELVSGIRSLEQLIPRLPTEGRLYKECQGDLARMNINLGVLLRMQPERVSETQSYYHEAILILEQLVTQYPQDQESRLKLGVAMLNQGNLILKSDRGGARQAREWLERARDTLSDLRNDFPGIPLYRRELANSLNSLTAALFALREFEEAKRQLTEATNELEQLTTEFPEYSNKVADCPHLRGVILGGLGAIHFEIDKDPETADRLLVDGIESQRRAVEMSPRNSKYSDALIGHLRYRARILRALDRLGEASEMERAANEIGENGPDIQDVRMQSPTS